MGFATEYRTATHQSAPSHKPRTHHWAISVSDWRAIERNLEGRNSIRHDTKPVMKNFLQVTDATSDTARQGSGLWLLKTYEQAKKWPMKQRQNWCRPWTTAALRYRLQCFC